VSIKWSAKPEVTLPSRGKISSETVTLTSGPTQTNVVYHDYGSDIETCWRYAIGTARGTVITYAGFWRRPEGRAAASDTACW
jgi:hypothetical protein